LYGPFYTAAANNQWRKQWHKHNAPITTTRPNRETARPPNSNMAASNCPFGPTRTESGTMYNTTITNSYKDDKSGEWKTTSSFSPTDLLVVGELARQAFAKITELKQQGRSRT
jgi:hypothetical protein